MKIEEPAVRPAIAFLLALLMTGCAREAPPTEDWRVLVTLPQAELPVRLWLAADGSEAWFENGRERVLVPEIRRDAGRWVLRFPAFNNALELQPAGTEMSGTLTLVKRGYEQVMPVRAEPNPGFRFSADPRPVTDLTGRWEVTFTPDEDDPYLAVGEFDQQGGRLTGTFLTAKGDYRFLAGEVDGARLRLSTFDGAHAYVFSAEVGADGTLAGDFWSGTRWHERWVARRNFDAALPDPYGLTYLKPGWERLDFSFPNLEGRPVSLSDPRYRGKVVLVTLAGTWCPNCADEAEFLAGYLAAHRHRGVEAITLLYEHVEEFEVAAALGRALRDKHGLEHELLIAGSSEKTRAAQTLPMLNHVLAYPTLILVDRSGGVRAIHTGFSGPATGEHYRAFVADFEARMEVLLGEGVSEAQ